MTKERSLDLGSGSVVRAPGALRGDISRSVRPDIVMDAARGLPFGTSTLTIVYCFDLLEHLDDVPGAMREIHRVLGPGGRIFITTPHFSSANSWTDPTHKQHFGWRSFDYFTADHHLRYYSEARFRIVHRLLRFHGGIIDAAVRRIAFRFPDFYERRLAWIFPAWYLEFELEVVKEREE